MCACLCVSLVFNHGGSWCNSGWLGLRLVAPCLVQLWSLAGLHTQPQTCSQECDNYCRRDCKKRQVPASPMNQQLLGNRERPRLIAQCSQDLLELLNLRVRLTGLVPQVFFFHTLSLMLSLSRNSFMPRCRLTRTEAGVSPVRVAISGPVIPSTSLKTSVSR